ncbi:MAG: class II fructose-bisphosphate aldolase [Oscillospiraceae bacterium]|nr:class II fructose-bisphosphate aldolase [Oscillospiraceae bacterium]
MLVTMKELLINAQQGGYAVAAPDVWDEFTIVAALQAAEEENAPVILGYNEIMADDIIRFGRIAVMLAEHAKVQVAITLDHGKSYEICLKAIRAGFTGVMIDRSTLPYDENVREVREVISIAHKLGITVEAELGHVGWGSNYSVDGVNALTDPEEAKRFVDETEVDALAVAIGTAHGMYKGEPHLDLDRLSKLVEAVSIPLVLHGCSGTGEDLLQKAIKGGMCKFNVSTDLVNAGTDAFNASMAKKPIMFFAQQEFIKGFKEKLKEYIRFFLSSNKAVLG